LLGLKTILVPPAPGVLSALGLLVSNLKAEFSRTCLQRAPHYDLDRIATVFAGLEVEAKSWLDTEGVPAEARRLSRQASLRYQHQGFELVVPWPAGTVDPDALQQTIAAFHRQHHPRHPAQRRDVVRPHQRMPREPVEGERRPRHHRRQIRRDRRCANQLDYWYRWQSLYGCFR